MTIFLFRGLFAGVLQGLQYHTNFSHNIENHSSCNENDIQGIYRMLGYTLYSVRVTHSCSSGHIVHVGFGYPARLTGISCNSK